MGQIFSKCLGSPKKRGKQAVGPATASPSGAAIVPPSRVTALTNETTQPPPEVANPKPTESIAPLSQTTAPAPKAAVPSPRERRAQLLDPVRPMSDHKLHRDFWKEAAKTLPELPDEWRTAKVDRESVVGMVKTEMEKCEAKQWKIKINGKEVIVREFFGKILDWTHKFAAVGDAAVQYDPGNAALPWAGFRFLLQETDDHWKFAVNDRETYSEMLAGLERATWLASYCFAQEHLYKEYFAENDKYSRLNDGFIDDLVHLYTAILRFLIQAHKYYTKGAAVRFAGAIISPSNWVRELIRAFDDRKARMEDYASLVHKSNVHQDLKNLLGMLGPFSKYMSAEAVRLKEEERQGLMEWLSDVDYRGDHKANSRNILKNSGGWMLHREEKFDRWKNEGTVLWLRGIPGAGKTKLSSTIVDHLMKSDEHHTVAYFYCIRDAQHQKNADPEEILRAILKQLVILLPSQCSATVKERYKQEKKEAKDHGPIRRLTFEECADFILELASAHHPVTIVIDALDECRESAPQSSKDSRMDRQDLLNRLQEMIATKPGNIKVFLSSRDDDDIWDRLQSYPNIIINASKNGDDILRFIRSEVAKLIAKRSYLRNDENLKEEIIEAVNTRADGMFRFADLQIGYLRDLNTRDSVIQRLRTLPKTLVQLYDEIYGRISSMVDEESSIAKRALSWLLCARRQLLSSELLAAVSPNPDQLVNNDEILGLCRHLVVLNPVSESFELAHLSVREYLETRDEYRDGHPHALIAERCIKLFDADVAQDILSRYASLYWADHYNSRPQTEKDALPDILKKFFHNKGVNPAFEKWAKLAKDVSGELRWDDNVRNRLRDAGYKPLSVVSVFGFREVLDQWMDPPPGYSYFRDSDDMVVQLAIKWGNKDVVRLLLRHDDKPTIDTFGWTSFVWAAVYTQLPVLEVLKELYGSVDVKDEMGWTTLHWMVFLGHTEGLKILLSVRAGTNMTDEAKWTALHWAAFLGRSAEATELASGGQGLDAKDRDGLTPFQWANFAGHEATATQLWTSEAGGSLSSSVRLSTSDKLVRMDKEFLSCNRALIYLKM